MKTSDCQDNHSYSLTK